MFPTCWRPVRVWGFPERWPPTRRWPARCRWPTSPWWAPAAIRPGPGSELWTGECPGSCGCPNTRCRSERRGSDSPSPGLTVTNTHEKGRTFKLDTMFSSFRRDYLFLLCKSAASFLNVLILWWLTKQDILGKSADSSNRPFQHHLVIF